LKIVKEKKTRIEKQQQVNVNTANRRAQTQELIKNRVAQQQARSEQRKKNLTKKEANTILRITQQKKKQQNKTNMENKLKQNKIIELERLMNSATNLQQNIEKKLEISYHAPPGAKNAYASDIANKLEELDTIINTIQIKSQGRYSDDFTKLLEEIQKIKNKINKELENKVLENKQKSKNAMKSFHSEMQRHEDEIKLEKQENDIRIQILKDKEVKQQVEIAKIAKIIKKLDILFEKSSDIYANYIKKYNDLRGYKGDFASLGVKFEEAVDKIKTNKQKMEKLIQEINKFKNKIDMNQPVIDIFEYISAKFRDITSMTSDLKKKYEEISNEALQYNNEDES
jgi:hypothetical protein